MGKTKSIVVLLFGTAINGNDQKAVLLFRTGTGNPKKLSRSLGTEIKGVPMENIREQEFPLMPGK